MSSKKRLRVSWVYQYPLYGESLVVELLRQECARGIEITTPDQCDLLIIGPYRKPFRPSLSGVVERWMEQDRRFLQKIKQRGSAGRPVFLYQTWENTRYGEFPADFSMTSDLGVASESHFRLPFWMGVLDWAHEGIPSRIINRVGQPVTIASLLTPLGRGVLSKARRAALICMHLKEPRGTLLEVVRRHIEVDGFGGAFQKEIKDHNATDFNKGGLLKNYGFCLCPENSMYPGYYTEKVPEAYSCGTIPIGWCDMNVEVDFNPGAFINLAAFAKNNYDLEVANVFSEKSLRALVEVPLLKQAPKLDGARAFLRKIIEVA
jgi:hypothetical protein